MGKHHSSLRRRCLGFLAGPLLATGLAADTGDTATFTPADCAECHESEVAEVGRGPHAVLDAEDWGLPQGAAFGCEACHGEAGAHMDELDLASVLTFRPSDPPRARSERCQTCHADAHPRFAASSHARAGLACDDCHTIHGDGHADPPLLAAEGPSARLAALDRASATCLTCHPQVFARFEMNERHRLHEGTLGCASCHDPHAPQSRRLLGGFKQQACVTCHADAGGPFVFEHAASRIEGCTACHDPHGSPNRHLLNHQNVAELCFSCHVVVPQFHFGFNPTAPPRFDLTTQCTNCHSTIHGSNFDPHFLQ